MYPRETLEVFDTPLASPGLRLDGVVIGGAALSLTAKEMADLLPWLEIRDLHPGWPAHVREMVADLGRRPGHGV